MKISAIYLFLMSFTFLPLPMSILWANETWANEEESNKTKLNKAWANENNENNSQTKKPDADEDDPLANAEVNIIKKEDRIIEEFRVNGQLLQVKITPKHGYPYYLIDTDLNGTFDVRSSETWSRTSVNTWKIFEW